MIDTQRESTGGPVERELKGLQDEIEQGGGSVNIYARLAQIAGDTSERVGSVARGLQQKIVESFAKNPVAIGKLSAVFLAAFTATSPAEAQERKELPSALQIVVPFGAGGPSDVVARQIADALKGHLPNVSPIVVNKPGAGGIMAARSVASTGESAREILFFNSGYPLAEFNQNFPPELSGRNMKPVGLINQGGLVLVASNDFPGSTLDELLQYLADNNQSMAHGGFGSPSYVCTLQILARSKTKINVVPYQGAGQALRDVAGQHVKALCALPADAKAQIDAGTVKAVAVTRDIPGIQVPTFEQQGHPSVDATVTNALAFPSGTPQELVDQISRALIEIRKDPAFNEKSLRFGMTVVPVGDSEDVRRAQEAQARWYLEELTKAAALFGKEVPPEK